MIKIYLTNLGKYNEGELIGEWVKLPVSEEELKTVMKRIGINEEYEEWFITDYETSISGFTISEYEDIQKLNEIARALKDADEYEKEIIEVLLSEGYELEEALEKKDDCMVYHDCNDMEDVAREYIEETGLLHDVPELLQNYFDFEAYGRDMGIEGTFVFTNNGNCVQIL